MRQSPGRQLIFLCVLISLSGCDRHGGLSESLVRHFENKQIRIVPLRVSQSPWSRSGYVIVEHSPEKVAQIIKTFGLRSMDADASDAAQRDFILRDAGLEKDRFTEAWGLFGRPSEFRLSGGGQLEYFILLVSSDGFMYLLAEYAYG
jgi:hypothetical protein